MKVLRILDSSGDTCIEFDEAKPDALAKAKSVFDEWIGKKKSAFLTKRQGGKPDEKITTFDQIEEGSEVVLVPAIVAG